MIFLKMAQIGCFLGMETEKRNTEKEIKKVLEQFTVFTSLRISYSTDLIITLIGSYLRNNLRDNLIYFYRVETRDKIFSLESEIT